jgi:predicted transcriptional regulator
MAGRPILAAAALTGDAAGMDDLLKRFLSAFNQVERYLSRVCGFSSYKPFYQLVERASEKVSAVKQYAVDLREFGDLRNAVMHGYTDDRPLATPHPDAVAELEKIRDLLVAPPRLGQTFRRKVFTCKAQHKIGEIVQVMFEKDYSQVPVYNDGRFLGLLNTETITRWLSSRFSENEGILEEETIGDVLPHAANGKRHEFLAEKNNAFDALDAFEKSFEAGKSLDAVLITANGKSSEMPIGILTIFDVPKLRSLAFVR